MPRISAPAVLGIEALAAEPLAKETGMGGIGKAEHMILYFLRRTE
jgi:hypothetical protein